MGILLQFNFSCSCSCVCTDCVVSSLKDEVLEMKQRVRVVIVENEKLHEELKAKAVEETLKRIHIVDSTVRIHEALVMVLTEMANVDYNLLKYE